MVCIAVLIEMSVYDGLFCSVELCSERFNGWYNSCFRSQPILTRWGEFRCAPGERSGDTWPKFMQCTGGLIPGGFTVGSWVHPAVIYLFCHKDPLVQKECRQPRELGTTQCNFFSSWYVWFCHQNLNLFLKWGLVCLAKVHCDSCKIEAGFKKQNKKSKKKKTIKYHQDNKALQ